MLPCHRHSSATVESFAQLFSAAQKQTEVIKHIMRRRKPAASTPAAAPQPTRSPCRPRSHAAAAAFHQAASWSRSQAGPPNLAASASARGPETGPRREETAHWEMVTAPPLPGGGPGGESFVFIPLLAWKPAVPKTSLKEQFPQSLGPKRGRVELCITGSLPSPRSPVGSSGCPRYPLLPIHGTR